MLFHPNQLSRVCCLPSPVTAAGPSERTEHSAPVALSASSSTAPLIEAALSFRITELHDTGAPLPYSVLSFVTGLQSRITWTPNLKEFLCPSFLGFCLQTLFQKVKCGLCLGWAGNWTLTDSPSFHLSPHFPAHARVSPLPLQTERKSSSLSSYGWLGVQEEALSVSTGLNSTQV